MRGARRKYAVIFDLEFTAWEGSLESRWTRPGELSEVVQIGAVKLDAASLKEIDSFDMLVRPRVNPVLSDYFTVLTGITNEAMDQRSVDFIIAYRAFLDFAGEGPVFAHGRDDLIFAGNLKLYGWERALPLPAYSNAIHWFAAQGVDLKGKRACDVAEAAGGIFEGQKHNALADARGVAAGFRALIGKGAPNPFLPN
ncbi:MAG TPA: 3'-5' exonuclease [Micropepsaceae bacterium]|nr:3'-5' exonuclease [Micropepsaceae bacterium]